MTVRTRGSTRTAMLTSAVEVLRERGSAGLTIDAVLARSGAPRGSVYHHFPGGRNQLLQEAVKFAGDELTAKINEAAGVSAVALLHQIVELWSDVLVHSDYHAGSPVLTAALVSGEDEPGLTDVARDILYGWRDAARDAYARQGFAETDATALAHTTIAALEGAVAMCRAMRTLEPLNDVARDIEFLIKAREFVSREKP